MDSLVRSATPAGLSPRTKAREKKQLCRRKKDNFMRKDLRESRNRTVFIYVVIYCVANVAYTLQTALGLFTIDQPQTPQMTPRT